MNAIFEKVAARANEGGLPIGPEAVREIDRLLLEERLKSLPSLKAVTGAEVYAGGDKGDESAGHLTSHGDHTFRDGGASTS